MTLPLPAADVLAEHVVFKLDCIDRMYCNPYVRKLTYPGGVASFFTRRREATFASTALADPISKQSSTSITSASLTPNALLLLQQEASRSSSGARQLGHAADLHRGREISWHRRSL